VEAAPSDGDAAMMLLIRQLIIGDVF